MDGERVLPMTLRVRLADLPHHVGLPLGPTEAVLISQQRINTFAECTLDAQWIHVDERRAAAGPWRTTIGHGFLTLSLLSHFLDELLAVDDAELAINYGLDRVRFPSVVPSGSLLSAAAEIREVRPADTFVTAAIRVTMAVTGAEKPACVADCVTRFVPRTRAVNS
jgi:acyl dehydratase